MTDAEKRACLVLGQAWNAMLDCGAADAEAAAHIHALQHAVMAKTAQRMNPDIFRQDSRNEAGAAPKTQAEGA